MAMKLCGDLVLPFCDRCNNEIGGECIVCVGVLDVCIDCAALFLTQHLDEFVSWIEKERETV